MNLCYYGCGNVGTYYSKYTKQYRCSKNWTQCPVGRKRRSMLQKERMKNDDIRSQLSETLKVSMNTPDENGITPGQLANKNATETKINTIDPETGLSLSKKAALKAVKTKINTIDPETGLNLIDTQREKLSTWANEINDDTGLTNSKTIGLQGGLTRKTKINPDTGLTVAQTTAIKSIKKLKEDIDDNGDNGLVRKNKKSAKTKYKIIDPTTGLNAHQTSGHKAHLTMMNDIDDNGLNGYDRARIAGKYIQYYKETQLYYQGSYELKFLEDKEREYGSLENLLNNIKRGNPIEYFDPISNTTRMFRPDFIDSNNTLFEIKSTFVAKQEGFEKLKAKLTAAKEEGYNTILIMDHIVYDWETLL